MVSTGMTTPCDRSWIYTFFSCTHGGKSLFHLFYWVFLNQVLPKGNCELSLVICFCRSSNSYLVSRPTPFLFWPWRYYSICGLWVFTSYFFSLFYKTIITEIFSNLHKKKKTQVKIVNQIDIKTYLFPLSLLKIR